MRLSLVPAFLCLLLAPAGCATTPPTSGHTYVLVRHAEKASEDPHDPSLSSAGADRALRIARSLQGLPVRAVYATAYRRTQQTAQPTARDHGLRVHTYDASTASDTLAAELRGLPAGVVLVVGHSNTIPPLAAALCTCTLAPIADSEFRRRITVRVDAAGHASVDDRIVP